MNKLFINEMSITIQVDNSKEEILLLEKLSKVVSAIHSSRTKDKYVVSSRYLPEVLSIYRPQYTFDVLPDKIKAIYKSCKEKPLKKAELLANKFEGDYDYLRPHQRRAVALSEVYDRFAFYYDTRTGKTPMSLEIISRDVKKNKKHKWLIICPLMLIENAWIEDINKFYPELSYVKLWDKSAKKRLALFHKEANIYIINSESFINYTTELSRLRIHGVFVDESSTMKSPNTRFSKEAVKFSTTVQRWYLLSGTPAPNSEVEYYMQLKSIDFYAVPQSYTQFKNKFFNNISYNPMYEKLILKPEKKEELDSLIRSMALYVDKKDVLSLPERITRVIKVPMPKEVEDNYRLMKKKMYLELKDEKYLTAENEAAKLNKLRQIASGFVYLENGDAELISNYKIQALKEILDKHPYEQVIIFANYRYEFAMINELLGDKCKFINSKVSAENKENYLFAFKRKILQYLAVNPCSLSMGVTLTNCHICVYFSMDYSYEKFYQSRDRIYADKKQQPNDCIYYFLQAKNSIDEQIYSMVNEKGDVSKLLLNYLKGESYE